MKVLIADDEIVSYKMLEKLIQSLGYETVVAMNGEKAWEIWKKERPKIVVTDWDMPEMDGLELCAKIRNSEGSQYTYIIMVTAKGGRKDVVAAMQAGADDFIAKPFTKQELEVRLIAGKRILNLETKDIVIFTLAKLAESRDSETGNHLERIRFYSKALATTLMKSNPELGIDRLFIDNIFLTSPLHDIGKIGIPDYILLKPGRFDDKEFKIMQTHSNIGFKALNEAAEKYPQADYLKMSAEIAHAHHEKYDGTGYPNRLKGNDIPLAARIVAVADVYDALINKRVYKDAFDHDMAKAILIEDRGTHFDPVMIDVFLDSENKFMEISNKFNAK